MFLFFRWSVSGRRFFTLIELLAVIAIIAILAAVVLPVMGSARAGALAVKCRSNIRQVAAMQIAYTAVSNGVFCLAYDNSFDQWDVGADYRSAGILECTLGAGQSESSQVFACPEADLMLYFDPRWSPKYAGYGYNYLLSFKNSSDFPPKYRPVKISRLRSPCKLIMLADAACILAGAEGKDRPGATSFLLNPGSGSGGYTDFRHSGGANAAFADGHVELLETLYPSGSNAADFKDRLGYPSQDDSMFEPF